MMVEMMVVWTWEVEVTVVGSTSTDVVVFVLQMFSNRAEGWRWRSYTV